MANPEHLEILRRGVSEWNSWRHSQLIAYGHAASVGGLHRFSVDLSRADLRGSDLSGAQFYYADLREARLEDTTLASVDFGILLTSAGRVIQFPGADLSGARLNRSILDSSTFEDTALEGTDFADALLARTKFLDVSLREAKGLDSCNHHGASYLDYLTLFRSYPLPLAFLRGCGLPQNLIEYLPSLLQQPIQFYSCFISYSTKDIEFAERLYAELQTKDVRCWYAPEDLRIGDKFRTRIEESIRIHDKLLLVLSENSIKSPWVEKEVETAFERERQQNRTILLPIRVDDSVMEAAEAWAADIRRTRHIGDFRRWKDHDSYKKAFERLLRDLKTDDKADAASAV